MDGGRGGKEEKGWDGWMDGWWEGGRKEGRKEKGREGAGRDGWREKGWTEGGREGRERGKRIDGGRKGGGREGAVTLSDGGLSLAHQSAEFADEYGGVRSANQLHHTHPHTL